MNTETQKTEISYLPEIKMHHATRAKALKLFTMLQAEYPALRLEPVTEIDEETGTLRLISWNIDHTPSGAVVWEGSKVPELSQVLEACEEQEIDPEEAPEGEDDDEEHGEKVSNSIVPETYRARYLETSSTGTSCGDWLAETLIEQTLTKEGLDMNRLDAILSLSGVDMGAPWARSLETRGWQGRRRMSGRLALEKVIARTGVIKTPGDEALGPQWTKQIDVPADVLEALRSKHAVSIAKAEKAERKEAEAKRAEEDEDDNELAEQRYEDAMNEASNDHAMRA